jgi:TatD DNase family protein
MKIGIGYSIIDTHAHLDQIENLDQSLAEAAQAGVSAVIAVGVDLASNRKNLMIGQSSSRPKVYVALGIHPGNIHKEEVESCLDFIRGHIHQAKAVGEIGLDFWYKEVRKDKKRKDEQRDIFGRQLELAREFGLPVIVHARGTWREALEMTQSAGLAKVLFHWYSGPLDVLRDILDCGYYISAAPSLAYSPQSREAIVYAPIEQTMIETDAPVFYRYPDREEGFSAHPKDVVKTLAAYTALKKIAEDEALVRLNGNAKAFFGLDDE